MTRKQYSTMTDRPERTDRKRSRSARAETLRRRQERAAKYGGQR